MASSLVGEDSLSHHVDPAIGVYIIDRCHCERKTLSRMMSQVHILRTWVPREGNAELKEDDGRVPESLSQESLHINCGDQDWFVQVKKTFHLFLPNFWHLFLQERSQSRSNHRFFRLGQKGGKYILEGWITIFTFRLRCQTVLWMYPHCSGLCHLIKKS